MLREMTEFSMRTVSTAEEWSSEREGQLTEELDAHLRAHRCVFCVVFWVWGCEWGWVGLRVRGWGWVRV